MTKYEIRAKIRKADQGKRKISVVMQGRKRNYPVSRIRTQAEWERDRGFPPEPFLREMESLLKKRPGFRESVKIAEDLIAGKRKDGRC